MERLLFLYLKSRNERKKWQNIENRLRPAIHQIMNTQQTDELEVGQKRIVRSYRTREFITKNNIPEYLWNRYADSSTFPVFTIKHSEWDSDSEEELLL